MAVQKRNAGAKRGRLPGRGVPSQRGRASAGLQAERRADGSRPQQVDKDTGVVMWSVQALDADPEARKNDKTVSVKLVAPPQPVPPTTRAGPRSRRSGSRTSPSNLRRRSGFDEATRSMGLEVTPHDLRRTFGSLAKMAGADLRFIQKAMGHESITTTARIYAHLYDDELDTIATALDGLYSAGGRGDGPC